MSHVIDRFRWYFLSLRTAHCPAQDAFTFWLFVNSDQFVVHTYFIKNSRRNSYQANLLIPGREFIFQNDFISNPTDTQKNENHSTVIAAHAALKNEHVFFCYYFFSFILMISMEQYEFGVFDEDRYGKQPNFHNTTKTQFYSYIHYAIQFILVAL